MYSYEREKEKIFNDKGQRDFIKVRDHVLDLLKKSGAVMMEEAMKPTLGDSWYALALVDRMVELGEIIEIPNPQSSAGQHRIFIKRYL